MSSLKVSEQFYSIQGEGVAVGVPSIFLRLTGCNLTCIGWASEKNPYGCDTTEVWRRGTKESFEDLYRGWMDRGWTEHLKRGAHLIVTGGEPMLQQRGVDKFLEFMFAKVGRFYVEVETNGTVIPEQDFILKVSQFNVSVKLSNNGDEVERRLIEPALSKFGRLTYSHRTSCFFKFVVTSEEDLEEIEELISKYRIAVSSICLMPEGTSGEELNEKSKWIVEICKEKTWRFSPRLHVNIWEKLTGV